MHFTTLFILKGEKLENLSMNEIENMFCERYCYCCGETHPKYQYWCDWFQIGGRWSDILKAKKGIKGSKSWCNQDEKSPKNLYSVVQIKDLTNKLPRDNIYAVATKSRIYLEENDWQNGDVDPHKFHQLLDQIDYKEFDGVIALIDCHD